MANATNGGSSEKRKNNALAGLVLLLLLLLLLLGGLLIWALMRLGDVENRVGMGGANNGVRVNSTVPGAITNGGLINRAPTSGGGTSSNTTKTGTPGAPGAPGSSTTITCPPPSQRVTLPNGTDACLTINPAPSVGL